MAEFIEGKEQAVNEGDPIIFENKTGSAFDVSAGIVFHKSGIYEVSIVENRTVVSKVMGLPKRGKWIVNGRLINCSVCKSSAWSRDVFENIVRDFNFCPNCGADMRGEQDERDS